MSNDATLRIAHHEILCSIEDRMRISSNAKIQKKGVEMLRFVTKRAHAWLTAEGVVAEWWFKAYPPSGGACICAVSAALAELQKSLSNFHYFYIFDF